MEQGGGCLPALDSWASAGHHSLGWAHCPCTDAAATPMGGGAQLRAHLSGQGGGGSALVASPRQDPASRGLWCTLWEAMETRPPSPLPWPPSPLPSRFQKPRKVALAVPTRGQV